MLEFKYHPFSRVKESEVLQFVGRYPWKPHWLSEHIKEFIQLLTSSTDLIFDLHNKNDRIAIAVLIDKIKNKGNNACLEVLALDQRYDVYMIYQYLIESAKQKLPITRSGIEVTIHESLTKLNDLLVQEGFNSYYDIFEMMVDLSTLEHIKINEISLLQPEDFVECYDVIGLSFKDNPEMAIPDYEEWEKSRRTSDSQIWVYKDNRKIVGFVNNMIDVQDQKAEIRSVGVLPSYRGKGLGRKLLLNSLSYFVNKGVSTCHLTVATKNRKALHLYEDIGFQVNDIFKVYYWNR
ncbi:MAG: GNAT family N-acetyltransferase [Candidatus Babeliales bacterium]|uniref:GNAT family N-acetyltransferase n=1 Tax=Candidatus Berkiella aquae TaxID=295108 RepID=A0A0Q9YAX8_9GAMM|nr:GNAT family N-acetyltransferase [Candidatus Berkiella aquae]MCS5712848.1 GNAT family N-acetyltransferase [Candidatus Berkiella aquae]